MLLIPGYFGFANFGDFAYFGHVRDALRSELHKRRLTGAVHAVRTWPTASLKLRAVRVLETIAEVTAVSDGDVHLIGHSSGGLDARLAVAPDLALPTDLDADRLARKVRTAVSLSSPHHGTPLAGFLDTILGPQLLRLISLSMMYTLRTGRVPIAAVLHVVRLLSFRRVPLAAGTLLSQLYHDLLADFSRDRRLALQEFFVDVVRDQALLGQLTPSGTTRLNAEVLDRESVRYGSVVTRAGRPRLRAVWTTGLSPYRQATYALFAAFHRITAQMPELPSLQPTPPQARVLQNAFGLVPRARDNDGMVPTLAQVWGTIVHAARGDHLDALGHFFLPEHVPPHYDWLNSGVGFTIEDFRGMWADVARFLWG